MTQDIDQIVEQIKNNHKVLLHEDCEIKIRPSNDDWCDNDDNVSIYAFDDKLPRNMPSLQYDLDGKSEVIEKAISKVQEEFEDKYGVDYGYADTYLDASNYIKPIADALKDSDCVVVPFYIGEHGSYAVNCSDSKNEYLLKDYKPNLEIDESKEIKKIILESSLVAPVAYWVDKNFELSSIKTNEPIEFKSKYSDMEHIQVRNKEDFFILDEILKKLSDEAKWKNPNEVYSNVPTGIAFMSKERFENFRDEYSLEDYIRQNVNGKFDSWLNGAVYDVIIDDCVEWSCLSNDELYNYIKYEVAPNEKSQLIDERVLDYFKEEKISDEQKEKLKGLLEENSDEQKKKPIVKAR